MLLPAPLRPISATRSPAASSRSRPRRTAGPSWISNQRPRTSRAGSDRAGARRRPPPRRAGRGAAVGRERGPVAQPGPRLLAPRSAAGRPASENSRAAGVASTGRRRAAHARKPRGAASQATRASTIAITRSAAGRQRSSRCSAITTAVPQSSLRRRSSHTSSSPATGSSCEVGSSSSSSAGRCTIAAAIATRWSSPPDSVSVRRSSRCAHAERQRRLLHRPGDRRGRLAAVLERQLELGAHAAHHHLGLGLLEDRAAHGGQLARPVLAHAQPGHRELALHLAAVEVGHEAAQRPQQRGLARAGHARQHREGAGLEPKRHVAQRGLPASLSG